MIAVEGEAAESGSGYPPAPQPVPISDVVNDETVPKKDPWRRPYMYRSTDPSEFTVASGGCDQEVDPQSFEKSTATGNESLAADIVASNGSFLSYPDLRNARQRAHGFLFENDLFGGSDTGYTDGVRIWSHAVDSEVPRWGRGIARTIERMSKEPGAEQFRFGWSLTQTMYTPENLQATSPATDDRPYGGWLFWAPQVDWFRGRSRHFAEFQFGIVGPWSQADDAQKFIHRDVTKRNDPQGWHTQIADAPGIGVLYKYERRLKRSPVVNTPVGPFIEFDVLGHTGGSLGSVITYANVGATLRVGHNLPLFTSDKIAPTVLFTKNRSSVALNELASNPTQNDSYERPDEVRSFYLFARFDQRAVADNLFLKGNSPASERDLTEKPFVHDLDYGFALQYRRFLFSYTFTERSSEFEERSREHRFGGVQMGWIFGLGKPF